MAISAKDVAALRKQTGAGMMDCKRALTEADGNMESAAEILAKKNLAAVGKRADKIAAEGSVGAYVHGNRIGVLVEINSETDFVGRSDEFQALVKDVAMHVAAINPTYLDDSEIPPATTAKQKEIFLAQMANEGKPEHILERIVEGKLKKWRKENCLLDQPFVKDSDKTVAEHVAEVAAGIKENIKIRRFIRFELGEGIERATEDFAAEVAKVVQGA